ncbi:MAG: hypothetical protein LBR54_03335, partial [Oscillospiraceae bacterium]|nr:hypothetical protein [Oscillospiraceae bacterium]
MNKQTNKKFALIGENLSYSVSKEIHTMLFEFSGYDGSYELLCVPREKFKEETERILHEYAGVNVTVPYKQAVMECADIVDSKALDCRAVNCVDTKDGLIKGYNTDVSGFLYGITGLSRKSVLLAGFGGTGSMIASEMLREGAAVTVCVRQESFDKRLREANSLAETYLNSGIGINMKVKPFSYMQNPDTEYDLLINATPVGRLGTKYEENFPVQVIKAAKAVYDVNYNP